MIESMYFLTLLNFILLLCCLFKTKQNNKFIDIVNKLLNENMKLRNKIFSKSIKEVCNHAHAWEFYPTNVWFRTQKVHGLKIVVCWECNSVIQIKNFAK